MKPKPLIYQFDDVRVDLETFAVLKGSDAVHLEPKAFEALVFFITNRGRLIEKQELLNAVWKDAFVTENAMTRIIAQLRKALGDDRKQARYIETVPTRGYRFIAEVGTAEGKGAGWVGETDGTDAGVLGGVKGPGQELRVEVKAKPLLRRIGKLHIGTAVLILIACFAVFWFFNLNAKQRWAREQAIPEINRLIKEDRYAVALALARKAEKYVPNDPVLSQLWPEMSREYSITTTPPGTRVYLKEYNAVDSEWDYLGQSPIERVRLPLGFVRWRLEKQGFITAEGASFIPESIAKPGDVAEINFTMNDQESNSPGMARVRGGMVLVQRSNIPPLSVQLTDYLMDKYEVTNKQYKEFIAAGGYNRKEYWKHKFVKDGRTLSWEEAMTEFRDATGRPGPSTWELEGYPTGQDDYPVAGVSWYEAAAYAEFAGKSLPTVCHWIAATSTYPGVRVYLPMNQLSNFGGDGPVRVGTYQGMGPFGTYDMAGNVREWCWNESGDRRCILGGAWNEPAYMFYTAGAQPPFDRSPINGFRCVRHLDAAALPEAVTNPPPLSSRDYAKEKPVSDDVFQIYQSLYAYDRTELNAKIEEVDETAEHWIRQKITFAAAYGNERVIAYLFLPKNVAPPYQTLICFSGVNAFNRSSLQELPNYLDFVMKSGRALMFPVYKGTFERRDGFVLTAPYTTTSVRDHMIQWSKDLGRSIDYLESRADIDRDKLGYYGISTGAAAGGTLLAVEKRIKVGVFLAGGLVLHEAHPQADPYNFTSRIKIPILMINGRYDFVFPLETSQNPMFRLLGTPEKDKRHVLFETQHMPFPRNQLIKEVLDWLDNYLGPVK